MFGDQVGTDERKDRAFVSDVPCVRNLVEEPKGEVELSDIHATNTGGSHVLEVPATRNVWHDSPSGAHQTTDELDRVKKYLEERVESARGESQDLHEEDDVLAEFLPNRYFRLYDREHLTDNASYFRGSEEYETGSCSDLRVYDETQTYEPPIPKAPGGGPPKIRYQDTMPGFHSWVNSFGQMATNLIKTYRGNEIPFGLACCPWVASMPEKDGFVTVVVSPIKLKNHWRVGDDRRLAPTDLQVEYNGMYDVRLKNTDTFDKFVKSYPNFKPCYVTVLEGVNCVGTSWNLAALFAYFRIPTHVFVSGYVLKVDRTEIQIGPVSDAKRKSDMAQRFGGMLIGAFLPSDPCVQAASLFVAEAPRPKYPINVVSFGQAAYCNDKLGVTITLQKAETSYQKNSGWLADQKSKVTEEEKEKIRLKGEEVKKVNAARALLNSISDSYLKKVGNPPRPFNRISQGLRTQIDKFLKMEYKPDEDKDEKVIRLYTNSNVYQSKGEGVYVPLKITYDKMYPILKKSKFVPKVMQATLAQKYSELEKGFINPRAKVKKLVQPPPSRMQAFIAAWKEHEKGKALEREEKKMGKKDDDIYQAPKAKYFNLDEPEAVEYKASARRAPMPPPAPRPGPLPFELKQREPTAYEEPPYSADSFGDADLFRPAGPPVTQFGDYEDLGDDES